MRKNWTMRVGVALVALTLITSCFVGGTFAKYTTANTGTDSARVAKFGVTVTANGTMFTDKYDSADEATVVGQGQAKVVAPGTKGNMTSMTLTGKPEVDVEVKYEATFSIGDKWTDGTSYYCPIIITVNDTKYDGATYADAATFTAAVTKAINDYTKVYQANTDLAAVGTESLKVSWEWPFSTSDANDVKDTHLGDEAADGSAAEIYLSVKTTVTQID